jgi:hypothetical protein
MVRIRRRSILPKRPSFRLSGTKISFHQIVAEHPLVADSPFLLRMLPASRIGKFPHNGMVRRGILEVVEFEDGGSRETTRDRY